MHTYLLLHLVLSVLFYEKKQPEPIKGTWITNVASDILLSKANIEKGIQLCKKNGINNVYVVVWNDGVTMYPSKVTEKYIGVKQDTIYKGRDPIKEMVEIAHQYGIKVHAWFEFGFSYSYKNDKSIWATKYPAWVGRDVKGNPLKKNNFYWWNSLNPEVQTFMTSLVLEVVNNYDIDGIQGDDRLPAMPSEGGYDKYTLGKYAKENKGANPPTNHKDSAWLQWRANILNKYGKSLYAAVKKAKPSCTVSWAPSLYPWSKEQYLQDWPTWLNGGYADYIIPQLYRYNYAAYEKSVKEMVKQVTPAQRKQLVPGMLTSLGDGYLVRKTLLDSMLQCNQQNGIEGSVLFYYETLPKLFAGN